ncbi:unnamed protein product [Somion occarium]|uniref:DUF6699 domain-containing protein n=1 Tax=Somion occarium TaxID=3059160 RepID=A0ABP1CT84_9APHY
MQPYRCQCYACRRPRCPPPHQPNHRGARPNRGILRNSNRSNAPQSARPYTPYQAPQNPGTRASPGRRHSLRTPGQNMPVTPAYFAPGTVRPPAYYFPDGSYWVPSAVAPGTLYNRNGTVATPLVFPAIVPTVTPTSSARSSRPLPAVTPNYTRIPHVWQEGIEWPPGSGMRARVVRVCDLFVAWHPNPSALRWDVSRLPSTATRRNHLGNVFKLAEADFNTPATTPPSNMVLITCRVGVVNEYWPEIEVQGSPVTVENVLDAVYDYFDRFLTQGEVNRIRDEDPDNFHWLRDAMIRRCQNSGQLYQHVWRQGFKRVDCLGDNRMFNGLGVEYHPGCTWTLDLKLTS